MDIIKSGGYKISALEIESVILESARIREVAVVGCPDPEWGERVTAFYVLKNEDPSWEPNEALVPFLKERMAGYKIPSRWVRVGDLPRNAMGKVLKKELKTFV
jgi:malonyl-CoA/methylmalonyl-CoA synthetase